MQRKCDLCREKKQPIETVPEQAKTLDLTRQDFKSALLNMFKELKKSLRKCLIKEEY